MASPKKTRRRAPRRTTLLIATRKGLWTLAGDAARRTWKLSGPQFLGHIVHHAMADPRDGQDGARGGAHRPSRADDLPLDGSRADLEGSGAAAGLQAGKRAHGRPHVLADAGTRDASPASGMPARRRRGCSARRTAARPGPASTASTSTRSARPGAAATRTARRTARSCIRSSSTRAIAQHLYIGMSSGGVFESTDGGDDWKPLNAACAPTSMPDPDPEFGHDPHCVRLHPKEPDRLYQQNHCGIYRLDRPAERWTDIGATMPKSVGSIGFPMVLHPRDPDTLWVFPMDGTSVWPRVSPGGKPAAYRSVNGGKTWQRQATGLPKAQAWWTVKRQAMTADACADSGRLLRDDERRGLGKPRRRPDLEMPGAASAAHLRGRMRLAAAPPGARRPRRP